MAQLMMYHKMEALESFPVKDGFTLRNFRPGEEVAWTRICNEAELSVMADDDRQFRAIITSHPTLVPERDVFFACRDGVPVATLTAYVHEDGRGDIHMVAAMRDARGHNLNRALLSAGLHSLDRLMTWRPRITALTTDDFRLPAIVGYLKAGFQPVEYDIGMYDRWKAVCDQLNIHGVEMLTQTGEGTGVIL